MNPTNDPNAALQALLGSAGLKASLFPPNSRYAGLEVATLQRPDGTTTRFFFYEQDGSIETVEYDPQQYDPASGQNPAATGHHPNRSRMRVSNCVSDSGLAAIAIGVGHRRRTSRRRCPPGARTPPAAHPEEGP